MKKSILNRQSKYIDWIWGERYQISITLFAAMLPPIIDIILKFFYDGKHTYCPVSLSVAECDGRFACYNYLFQAIFILVTLFVLIHNMRSTNDTLRDNKELIANYIERNTNKRIRRCDEKYFAFKVVSVITRQFYILWIVVWLLWLIYYVGMFSMHLQFCTNESPYFGVFEQVFDFLSTAAMFGIYLVLNTVTTQFEKRSQKDYGLWNGILFLVLLFAIWLSILIIESTPCMLIVSHPYEYSTLFVSVFSTITFVMVLGKLNSNYLQIPPLFLFVLYLYAIIQVYVPFKSDEIIDCFKEVKDIPTAISFILPYATLIGKLFVMLTLCWIVDKKRLIFFIIHKSAAMDETPVLLDELDSEPVVF